MIDYYQFLGLSRQSGDDEVAKAYRRYALAYNPQCHPEHPDPSSLERHFKTAAQAYTVLSNLQIRAIYDLYGEEGVRRGGTGTQGVPGGVDLDQIDPNVVFTRFFGVDNPFQVMGNMDGVKGNQHEFFSKTAGMPPPLPKSPPLEVILPVSLEDIFYGAVRRAAWTCTNANVSPINAVGASGAAPAANISLISTRDSHEVKVEKGAKTGDRYIIPGRGNTAVGCQRGDVVVVLDMVPHHRFRREGDDLVTTVPISLKDALCGTTVHVKTMEGRELSLLLDEVVGPTYRTRIAGEGLPSRESGEAVRGDLVLTFATTFPSFLTAEQKSELRRIFDVK